ncbi:MAG: isoprenylcysteine carboxylmethyltransferase family protein [Acidobacteria bacterium]|nr:isoprenylcysteine carboxylmethyltransferase family protein [Acidobacteriota bacterium]
MSVPFELQLIPTVTFAFVMLSWWVFAGVFLARKKPPKAPETKKDSASRWGIVLQGLSYGIVWGIPRGYFIPLVPMPRLLEIAAAVFTMAASVSSVWIIIDAVRTLGKQWSFQARLVEGHKLIVSGPYQRMRHPIYTGMFGILLATGLSVSRWYALAVAVLLFALGTAIRVRSEEKLLRETFGDDFEAYARYIPAVLPRLF